MARGHTTTAFTGLPGSTAGLGLGDTLADVEGDGDGVGLASSGSVYSLITAGDRHSL